MDNMMLDDEWRENFGLSKVNFFKLCEELRAYLHKKTTNMRKPVSVKKQIAVTLYYLSDEGRYRKVANAFGLGKTTVSEIVRRFCAVISIVFKGHSKKNLHPPVDEVIDFIPLRKWFL